MKAAMRLAGVRLHGAEGMCPASLAIDIPDYALDAQKSPG